MGEVLKTAEGVATVVIAIYVAAIGTSQWYVSREKLRLDLYERRFDVLARTLDFVQGLAKWHSLSESDQEQKHSAFIRAARESRFLFASEPRICQLLDEINVRSAEQLFVYRSTGKTQPLILDPTKETADLLRLETLLSPFLAFRQRQVIPSLRKLFHRPERK